ncbi:hypothetical protein RZS08_43120, partial [Arthrospira platensis SPKY1]|nr:hypothetical protein [Arthrospira platensis SPKY1]
MFEEMQPTLVYTLEERSALQHLPITEAMEVETRALRLALARCRVIKTDYEIYQLKRACEANDKAYEALYRQIKPGDSEYTAQAIHQYVNTREGLLHPAYTGIFA